MADSRYPLSFPRVYKPLALSAIFREQVEDFYVNEVLGFIPSGLGEHVLLHIEKTGQNTHWVAEKIAEYAGVNTIDVGFCGRKDRHAVTRQWFSVYLPHTPNIDWQALSIEGIRLLKVSQHQKKLRPGMHLANEFCIRLRRLCQSDSVEPITEAQKRLLSTRFQGLSVQGVPNYFGEQRFGRNANNLAQADAWLVGGNAPPRKSRSIVLSAARSYIFNQVLAYRVNQGNWQQVLTGDLAIDNMPTGPLWGRGRAIVSDETLALDSLALKPYEQWCERLEHRGLQQERRSLVLMPSYTQDQWQGDDWLLTFTLPVGTFATVLLDELVTRVAANTH